MYLQMQIITFADLLSEPEPALRFIRQVWETILPRPFKMEAVLWAMSQPYLTRPRHFSVTQASSKWQELEALIAAGGVERLTLIDWQANHPRHHEPDVTDTTLTVEWAHRSEQLVGRLSHYTTVTPPRAPKRLQFKINDLVWGGRISSQLQHAIVQLAQDLFSAVQGTCGFIELGEDVLLMTPHEQQQDMPQVRYELLASQVRGVFWGNLLSGYHVQALGGVGNVMQNAPCDMKMELPRSAQGQWEGTPVYLQLSADMAEATAERRVALAEFLAPILVSIRSQRAAEVLDAQLVRLAGDTDTLRQRLAAAARETSLLPGGALSITYDLPPGWSAALGVLKDMYKLDIAVYRQMPHLDMSIAMPINVFGAVTNLRKETKHAPPLPLVRIWSGIGADIIQITVVPSNGLDAEQVQALRHAVEVWSASHYDLAGGRTSQINACSGLQQAGTNITWHADLNPIGQDAYIQLVLTLDDFSRRIAPLAEIQIRPWPSSAA
jgi:hypothetical protein